MTVTALPDLGAAIMLHLIDSTDIAAFTTNFYLEWPSGDRKIVVPPFKTFILIEVGKGGPGDIGLGHNDERVDIKCYGKNAKTAHDMWRTMDFYLLAPDRSHAIQFKKANASISSLGREGGPLRLFDADLGNHPFTVASYRFVYTWS